MAAFVNLRDAVLARAAKAVVTRCRNMELPRSFNGVRTCSMIAALRLDAKDGMPECPNAGMQCSFCGIIDCEGIIVRSAGACRGASRHAATWFARTALAGGAALHAQTSDIQCIRC